MHQRFKATDLSCRCGALPTVNIDPQTHFQQQTILVIVFALHCTENTLEPPMKWLLYRDREQVLYSQLLVTIYQC